LDLGFLKSSSPTPDVFRLKMVKNKTFVIAVERAVISKENMVVPLGYFNVEKRSFSMVV
jgi:hypothetical protein